MDFESIVSAVNNVAFPIVAFLLMFYQSNTTIKECTAAVTKLSEVLSEELE